VVGSSSSTVHEKDSLIAVVSSHYWWLNAIVSRQGERFDFVKKRD
jgi:hypothetical protein